MHRIFNVVLAGDSIGFRIVEDLKIPLKRFQMFVRPFGFEVDMTEMEVFH